jgi:hypothetical protein
LSGKVDERLKLLGGKQEAWSLRWIITLARGETVEIF